MTIEWSEEDGVYVVSFPEWGPQTHTHGATYAEAVEQGQQVLADLIDLWRELGRELPAPHMFAAAPGQ